MGNTIGFESLQELDDHTVANRFLELDKTIFQLPEADSMLSKVINQFHIVAERLDILPIIAKETLKNPYYKYRYEFFEEEIGFLLDVSLYTPVPKSVSEETNMTTENTHALVRWPNHYNTYEIVKPLERDEDKKKYLEKLQQIISKGLQKD